MSDEVGRTSYLVRRPGSNRYYYKRRFPAHLIEVIGREVFHQSTKKSDWREAKNEIGSMEARYRMAIADAEEKIISGGFAPHTADQIIPAFPTARFPTAPSLPRLSDEQAVALATRYFRERLLELTRQGGGEPFDTEWAEELDHRIAMLRDGQDDQTLRWTQEQAARLLIHHGIAAEPHRDAGLLLVNLIRRALLQLLTIEKARLGGDFSDRITDGAFQAAQGAPVPIKPPTGATLGSLVHAYEEEGTDEGQTLTAKTRNKHKAAHAVLLRFFGPERIASQIDRAGCRSFRNTLAQLPPNFTKRIAPDASLADLALANERASGPTVSRATQETYLRALSRLLSFAKAEKLISDNPMSEPLHPKGARTKREQQRNAYSTAQLRKIFAAPIYTGCVDDERGYAKPRPGNVIRRSRFWVPLIALFTGLRMNEILQLTRWHVRPAPDGLPCLLIGENMQVKTEASYRVVPIPDILLKCGFAEFAARRKDDDDLVFDDVEAGSDGYRSSIFSKRYATFQKSLELDEPGRKVSFHSFRHTFRDALRLPDVDTALAREIGGWSRGGDTFDSYGDGARAVVLRPLINRVAYDVDFAHLFT